MNNYDDRQIRLPRIAEAERAIKIQDSIKAKLRERGHDNSTIYDTINSLNEAQQSELLTWINDGYQLPDAMLFLYTGKRKEARHAS